MTIYHINDGPDYHPNKKRKVEVMRQADLPGMVMCRDIDTNESVIVEIGKLERAQKETQ